MPKPVLAWAEVAENNVERLAEKLVTDIGYIASTADRSVELSKAGFVGSFLLDVLRVGGQVAGRESTIRFAWPDWSGPNGREATRLALLSTKEQRALDPLHANSLRKYFLEGIEGSTLATALSGLTFRLVQVPPTPPSQRSISSDAQCVLQLDNTPSKLPLRELFEFCLRYWSMPYRGRTGRSRRFVVMATRSADHFGSRNVDMPEAHLFVSQALDELFRDKHDEVVVGILELGDEAPFCPWRDDLLGLSPKSFCEWIAENPLDNLRDSIKQLKRLRRHFRRKFAFSFGDFDIRMARARAIVRHSKGLSVNPALEQDDTDDKAEESFVSDEIAAKKAATYAGRLIKGEVYLRKILSNLIENAAEVCFDSVPDWSSLTRRKRAAYIRNVSKQLPIELDPKNSDLIGGVRAVHDIMLPRVHMEATVLGAIPPFSDVLGGKAIVSMLSHPAVVAAPMFSDGTILRSVFDKGIYRHLRDSGALCVTTKGLYAGHSSLYNRASLPGTVSNGQTSQLKLLHLANTGGATTTMLSSQTANFAWEVNHEHAKSEIYTKSNVEEGPTSVAGDYGSGGAKRHRVLEFAAKLCGIPADKISAGIRRPVYGVRLVSNAPSVCWTGCEPNWLVEFPPSACRDSGGPPNNQGLTNAERRIRLHETLSSQSGSPGKQWDTHATNYWRAKWLAKAQSRISDTAYVAGIYDLLNVDSKEES